MSCNEAFVSRGRRRIGKSTLLKQFAKNAANYMNIQGLSPATVPNFSERQKKISNFGDIHHFSHLSCIIEAPITILKNILILDFGII